MGKHSRTNYRGNSTKRNRDTGGGTGQTPWGKRAGARRAGGGGGGEQEPRPRLRLLKANGEVVLGPHTLNWPLAQSEASGNLWAEPVSFDEDKFGWKIYDTNNKRYLDIDNYAVVTVDGNVTTTTVESRTIPTEKTIDYYLFDKNTAELLVDISAPTQEELDTALDTAERVLKYKDFHAPVVTWEDPSNPIQYEKHSGSPNINTVFTYGDEFWAHADLEATVKLTYGIANVPINGADTDAKIKGYIATAGIGEYTYTVTVKDIYSYANQLNMETGLTKIIQVVDTVKPEITVTMNDLVLGVEQNLNINYGTVTVKDGFDGEMISVTVDAAIGDTEVKLTNGVKLGTLTVALTKGGVAVDLINTPTIGDVYEVRFDFTDGTNDAVHIIKTVTIKAAPTTNWSMAVDMFKEQFEASSGNKIDYGQVSANDNVSRMSNIISIHSNLIFPYIVILTNMNDANDELGILTITLTNDNAEKIIGLIDTSATGDYKLTFEFTDGTNDADPITRTITIIAEAPELSNYSLLVGGKNEDEADMLIVYDGDDGSIKVTKAPFLTDGAQYHLNGLSFVLPLDDLAYGVESGSAQDTSAQNAFVKFDDLIKYRDSGKKGAKFTNISTGSSPATFGDNRAVITQKYQFPIIPKREGGAIMEIKNGEEDWTGDKLDVNNITAGKTKREMHLVLAQQIGGLALTKSNIDNNYTLGDPLWTHTSRLALQNADNGTNGPKTLAINASLMPVTRPGYPYVIDTDYYNKSGNEQPASEDIEKPWKPSRKELLKFFGWQEAAINAQADGEVKDFSLDAWQWMADTETNVPGLGVLGQNGRSKELRGHIRMGSVKPSNGAKFAVENNTVVGIDIGGGHILEKKEKDEQASTLQEQGVAAALSGGGGTKFYSAIGKIDPKSTLFLPEGNTAGTETAIFYNIAFKFKNIFL